MSELQIEQGYDLLGQTGDAGVFAGYISTALPVANAALTLFQSNIDGTPNRGLKYKQLIFNLFTDQVSATNGFKVDVTWNKGGSWRNLYQQSVTVLSTPTEIIVPGLAAPDFRVTYLNGAVNTGAFEWALLGDCYQRGGF